MIFVTSVSLVAPKAGAKNELCSTSRPQEVSTIMVRAQTLWVVGIHTTYYDNLIIIIEAELL